MLKTKENMLKNSTKRAIKPSTKSIKNVKYTGKQTIKTMDRTAKVTKETVKTSKRTLKMMKESAKKTAQTIKAAIKLTIKMVKLALAAAKGLIALLVAGGWIVVTIVIIVCLIGLMCSSIFGIFFSSQKTNNGTSVVGESRTMNTVIADINKDFMDKLKEIQNNNTHDDYDITSDRAEWKEILALYAVKVNNGDNATEVVTLTDDKVNTLKSIFWDMNEITYTTKNESVEITTYDDNDNATTKTVTKQILHITVTSKSVDEMMRKYNFTSDQKKQIAELLSEEYKTYWLSVIYGTSIGDSDIVAVAALQLGNVGGQPYWSWYGFDARVEWCATFVSWCANECGYIDAGIIPKFAACQSQGVSWFKACGLWKDGGFIPKPGDIIFFDWDADASADHVGIVEFVADGKVHTIEGNSDNECRQREYSINSEKILGYGIPLY